MSINDGLALIRRHDFEGALPLLAAEVRKRPDDAYAAYYLAYAFVGAQDPLAGRNAVDFADLDGRDMALLAAPHVIRALTDAAMFNLGVKPRIAHEMSTQRTVAAVVAAGGGIGFVDSHLAATLDPARIAVVPLKQRMAWDINLVWRRDRAPTRVMTAFIDWLKARDIDRGRVLAAS